MSQNITLFADVQDDLLAALIATDAMWEDPTVDLVSADWTPGPNIDPADAVVPTNVEFPGYAVSSAVTWIATPVNLASGDRALIGSEKNFIASADPPEGVTIYGFRLNGAGGAMLVHWDTPRVVLAAGDHVTVDPYLIVGQATIAPQEGV